MNRRTLKKQSSLSLYWRLLAYAKKYWRIFLVAIGLMAITALTEAAFPAVMKPLMDKGFQGVTTFQVWWVPAAILLIFAARGLSGFGSSYVMSWIANNVLRDLRTAMFDKLLVMPTNRFDTKSSGQLISRVIAEVNGVTAAATNVINTLLRDSLILIGLTAWLFWLNWQLTLVVILMMPILGGATLIFSRRMRKASRRALNATGEMTRSVEEVIHGNRVVKIFQGAEYERKRFGNFSSDYRRQAMRLAIAQSLQSPIGQFIAAIGVAVVLTIALLQARAGSATIGDFVSYITAMLMMFTPLRHLADVNTQLQRGLAAAEAVFELIDEKSERDLGTRELLRARGEIKFKSVSFSYCKRDQRALNGVNFTVNPGDTVAFVGSSGSGKTTLMSLIARLYEPTEGEIRLDGIPLQEFKLASLRSQIALVSQDVVLFNDTLRNNVAYGAAQASDEEIYSSMIAADLGEFIEKLPEGIKTLVGDRGVRLSGGQRQRIAIARAILKNAPILLLDEATSALDNVSESNVQRALDHLRKGRTTLVVAHRLSTIEVADRIYVLNQGEIVEDGTHPELLAADGVYARLYEGVKLTNSQSAL